MKWDIKMTTLICTAGLPGAGKSIFVKAARQLRIPTYIMGDIIRREAKARYGRDDAYHTGLFMREIREKFGREIVAKLTLKTIEKEGKIHKYILIDGLRNIEELECFKKAGYNVELIAILAGLPTRYSRIINRNRVDDIKSLKEFVTRENREREIGLVDVIRQADYYFINEGITEKESVEKAMKLLRIIMGEKCEEKKK